MANGQPTVATEEQRLRHHIDLLDRGEVQPAMTDDVIFASGAYPRPIIGREQLETHPDRERLRRERQNMSSKRELERLVVSQSGDLAYAFGRFHLTWDTLDQQHISIKGSFLTVWRKVDDEWRIEASFNRPNRD